VGALEWKQTPRADLSNQKSTGPDDRIIAVLLVPRKKRGESKVDAGVNSSMRDNARIAHRKAGCPWPVLPLCSELRGTFEIPINPLQ